MRVNRIAATSLIFATLATLAYAAPAGAASSDERELLRLTNAERAARGLRALSMASDLVAVARDHSEDMARAGSIWHEPKLRDRVDGWVSWGSNVGKGSTVRRVHDGFMASSGHRANILGSQFEEAGMGVAAGSDGTLYVTQIFVRRASSPRTVEVSRSSGGSDPRPAATEARPRRRARPAVVRPDPRTVDILLQMARFAR